MHCKSQRIHIFGKTGFGRIGPGEFWTNEVNEHNEKTTGFNTKRLA